MGKVGRSLATCLVVLLACAAAFAADKSVSPVLHHVRVPVTQAEGVANTSAITYPGFVWMTLTDAQMAQLRTANVPFQEDTEGFALTLGGETFDPIERVPASPAGLAMSRASRPDLHLVQFSGPAQNDWLDELHAAGLEVVEYIAPHTYVVWGKSEQCTQAATRTPVRWSGDFAPAYRILPANRTMAAAGPIAARALVYRGADVDEIRQGIAALGAMPTMQGVNDQLAVVTFNLPPAQLVDVAKLPGVLTVQPVPQDGGARGELSDQVCVNNINGSNIAFPGYETWLSTVGLSGAGVIIANVDQGIDETHPDLVNRMLPCLGTTCGGAMYYSGHGTHTAGIMVADGSAGVLDGQGFLRGLGMAPGANLVEQVYGPIFGQPGFMLTLIQESYANGASLSGNSWGPAGSPHGYDIDTQNVDIGVRDADPNTPGNQSFHFVVSIMNGNGGTSTQGTPDEGKNLIAVGSTRLQSSSGAQYTQINDVSANSAHGPALDGRNLPQIVAPGCRVDSTVSGGGYAVSGYCGTSMASPHVTGTIALFIEYYRSLPGYVADPSPALVKAALTAVAHDLAGHLDADGGVLGHPFDSKQGWGRLDAEAVLDPPLAVKYFDNPVVLDNTSEEWSVMLEADDPLQDMRLMLAWTDAPGHGLGGGTPAWNNDLDLVVEVGANTYLGNHFGANGYSTTGGTAEFRNNTEGVFLPAVGSGPVTVRVVAASINSDAIPGEGDATDQDFSLVCYNCKDLTIRGDYNDDGDVDLGDYAAWTDCMTGPGGGPVDPSCDAFDLDTDDDVDAQDFSAFQSILGGGS
ncbi:MAG: S8 family serine peptidase [Phycisphaerales bacterium]|nr:S8 family serine peptidase [Phycisphaerales bacterium]